MRSTVGESLRAVVRRNVDLPPPGGVVGTADGQATTAVRRVRLPVGTAWVYLGLSLLLTFWYAASPIDAAIVPIVTSGATLLTVFIGPWAYQPTHRRPWRLMALAVVFWLLGAALRGQQVGGAPLVSDLLTLPGYLLFAACCVDLLRARGVVRHVGASLDGLVLGTSAALLGWRLLVEPVLHGSPVSTRQLVFNLIYPAIDLLLLLVWAQLSFTDVSRTPAYWLFVTSVGGLLVGDVLWNDAAAGASVSVRTVTVPYLLAYGAVGASLLHPSMARLTAAQRESDVLPIPRVLTLAVALAGPTALAALQPGTSFFDQLLVGVAGLGLSVLVLLRTARATNAFARQATHDELTGLPNRRLFMQRLERCLIEDARRRGITFVLFLDLDAFKLVNDSWGHEVGDELLVQVARRLDSTLGADGMVARIGGDEFVVMAPVPDQALADPQTAVQRVSGRLIDAFHSPFRISPGEVFVTPSVGAAWHASQPADLPDSLGTALVPTAPAPSDERADVPAEADEEGRRTLDDEAVQQLAIGMLRDADTAMYEAKAQGRGQLAVFDIGLRLRVRERLELENALRRALERDELSLAYQPLIDLSSGRLVGWEALARWVRPEVGPVSPADFIPVAEHTGLIVPLGEWALREALTQLAHWQRLLDLRGLDGQVQAPYMSVNVATRQLRDANLAAVIRDALTRNELPAAALCVEITESTLLDDDQECAATITELRQIGTQLAVDDFGTGYSALGYLQRFPFTTVKIDRSFVSGLETSPDDAAIVKAVLAMAQALGLHPVAEGVETTGQARILAELGCPTGQGYLFGRPATVQDATADLLSRTEPWIGDPPLGWREADAKVVQQRQPADEAATAGRPGVDHQSA